MMRRLLRWVVHLVCVLCLLLGLTCLIAWPVSYWRMLEVQGRRFTEDFFALNFNVYHGRILFFYATRPSGSGSGLDIPVAWDWWVHEPRGRDEWFALALNNQVQLGRPSLMSGLHTHIDLIAPLGVFAAVLLLPIPFWLRSLVRRMRLHHRMQSGLCLHCGYNLHGSTSDTCPECGHERPMVTVS